MDIDTEVLRSSDILAVEVVGLRPQVVNVLCISIALVAAVTSLLSSSSY